MTITEHFARSMSLADAMSPDNLLAYEMNGEPLPPLHGFPLRLIAPGWYGIANVKWLTRIEVRDSRYQGNFMARDYVTIREEEARRGDGLDLHLGRARPAQVGPGEGDEAGRRLPDHGRRLGRADRQGRGADRRRPGSRRR